MESVSTEAAVLPDKKTSCGFAIERALFKVSPDSFYLFSLHSFLIRQVLLTFAWPLTRDPLKEYVSKLELISYRNLAKNYKQFKKEM